MARAGRQVKATHRPIPGDLADLISLDLAHRQGHATAVFAELHRIGQQVVDDLLGLAQVELKAAKLGIGVEFQLDALQCGFLAHDQ